MGSITRRGLILGVAAAAGGSAVLLSGPLLRRLASPEPAARPLGGTAWLHIAPDGIITAYCNIAEMGQGAVTGLLQALADELDADWTHMRFELGPVDDAHYGRFGYYTAGSNSIRKRLPFYRELGAAARAMLIAAAARKWGVPQAECSTAASTISHAPTNRSARYADLAEAAALLPVPEQVPLKPPDHWTLIGQPLPRLDTAAKVDGSALYGIDVEVPQMLVAAIKHCPVYGGRLKAVREAPALALAGVRKVVVLDDAVAVLADGYWQASKGLEALQPEWDIDPALRLSTADIAASLDAGLASHQGASTEGPAPSTPGTANATYQVPLLAQAPLEPMNATAHMAGGRIQLWATSQEADACRSAVAEALQINPDAVTIHRPLIGGGFGRRLDHDYAVEAALIARAAAVPVKVIWSREDDYLRTTLRSMAKANLQARLDPDGNPSELTVSIASLGPWRSTGGVEPPPYQIPRVSVNHSAVATALRIGSWRSVDYSHNVFFLESFIDECAAATGKDPLEFRQRLLEPASRISRVVYELQDLSKYVPRKEEARPIGFACFTAFGSHAALALELEPATGGHPVRVVNAFCVVDCGLAVNPDLIRSQIEGGIIQGLSAALGEQITIEGGQIAERDFIRYPLLRIGDAPRIEIRILDDPNVEPGGIGELAVPLVAPALANAVYRLTGQRPRTLPVKPPT